MGLIFGVGYTKIFYSTDNGISVALGGGQTPGNAWKRWRWKETWSMG
jgi:hypothetical protein